MNARDLMSHPVATCHVNDPLTVAAHLMWEHDCGVLPVINAEGTLVGVITDRDICMAAFTQGRALDAILVNSAMAKHVVSARSEQSHSEIERMMARYQIRRVPVIDSEGRPIGVVSLNDLARESVQPDSMVTFGPQKIAHTLAAICRPRTAKRAAA